MPSQENEFLKLKRAQIISKKAELTRLAQELEKKFQQVIGQIALIDEFLKMDANEIVIEKDVKEEEKNE